MRYSIELHGQKVLQRNYAILKATELEVNGTAAFLLSGSSNPQERALAPNAP